jgi:DNA-directed RNA polymerase specialized sigma24 family protein
MLLRAYRHRVRWEDLEDCYSQATLELVAYVKTGGRFSSTAHLANALEQRFRSRIQDRRRAVRGRSSMQTVLELALAQDEEQDGSLDVVDPRPGVEELVLLRMELHRLLELARELTADQRLVLACQISLQMGCAEFCRCFGWSSEKYRKVAQRARTRLRELHGGSTGVPLTQWTSEKEIGTHL